MSSRVLRQDNGPETKITAIQDVHTIYRMMQLFTPDIMVRAKIGLLFAFFVT
jgi:hypothetical protein